MRRASFVAGRGEFADRQDSIGPASGNGSVWGRSVGDETQSTIATWKLLEHSRSSLMALPMMEIWV